LARMKYAPSEHRMLRILRKITTSSGDFFPLNPFGWGERLTLIFRFEKSSNER